MDSNPQLLRYRCSALPTELDGDWERKNKDERAINEKNRQVCPQQKLLAIFAGNQIRDRQIKSPSVSWA